MASASMNLMLSIARPGLAYAAVATSAPASHSRGLLFQPRGFALSEGDEGDEGNEGGAALFALFHSSAGNEGDEGDEGDEGHEGDEGDEGDGGDEGDEGYEGPPHAQTNAHANGDEGNEGNEGDEGGLQHSYTTVTQSSVHCASVGSSGSFREMTDAHAAATVDVLLQLCHLDTHLELQALELTAFGAGSVVAQAVADAQAACESEGRAFGCAGASATADAWAAAAAEAHATAVARGAASCECLATAEALTIGQASEFVELVADAFARAEVTACSTGDETSYATAYAACAAKAYARLFVQAYAKALVANGCFDADSAADISAVTAVQYTVIEGCQRGDSAGGNGSGSSEGSSAQLVATEQ